MDAEEVRAFLNEWMGEICASVEENRGRVHRFLGDAGFAVFEEGDEAVPAVKAALAIQERMAALNERWTDRLGQMAQVHIGIESGVSPDSEDGTAGKSLRADTIIIATRLKDAAGPGETLVGEDTHRRTSGRFSYVPMPVAGTLAGGYLLRAPASAGEMPGPGVARPVVEAGGQREDERRQVTVLFADLVPAGAGPEKGKSGAAARHDPELHRALATALAPYDGVVETHLDHTLMGVFGAPTAHEDDPLRAVCSALALLECARSLEAETGRPLRLQIGINTGAVVAGEIGVSGESAYALTGDTVNTAARFRAAARAGQILVGADTYRLTERWCDYQPLEPLRLRGKSQPVAVYALLGRRTGGEPARGLEQQGIRSPLVGREPELAALSRALGSLREGRGGIARVRGEAGVGKSRLVAEARGRAADLEWLEGRAVSYGAEISYGPFVEILRRACEVPEDAGPAEAWWRLQTGLAERMPEHADHTAPYMAALLGIEVPDPFAERVRYLDADAIRRQIFLGVRRLFESMAAERPLVLVFEDLHWADHSTRELLDHVRPLVRERPLLLVILERSDRSAPPAAATRPVADDLADVTTEIVLEPLPRPEAARLLQNLLPVDNLPPQVRDRVLTRSEGNPFFVEEAIRTLVDLEMVTRDARTGSWSATERVADVVLPDTVQGLVMARVDRLDEGTKHVLRIAAVAGRTFFYGVVQELAGRDAALDDRLARLQELELIRVKSRVPELQYTFQHALVQDAVYESILRQRRKELHSQVLEALEGLYEGRLEEHYGLLAYHAARAEDWEKALKYLLRSGDQSGKIAADSEALAHYQQALAAYARVFGEHWDPFRRAVLERKIGEAYFRRGELQQATECLQRALQFLGSPYPQSRGSLRAGLLRELLRQVAHDRFPKLLLRRRPGEDQRAIEEAEIYHFLAWISYNASHDHLLYDCLSQLNVSERGGVPEGIVRGSMAMGLVYDSLPLHGAAERYHRRAIRMSHPLRDRVPQAQAYLGLGMHQFDRGRWDDALETMERARGLYRDAGDMRGWGAATNWVFWVYAHRGQLETAAALAAEMAAVGEDSADAQLWGWGAQYWGSALARRGHFERAVPLLQRGSELYRSIGDVVGVAQAGADLALCAARQGDLECALALIESSTRGLLERGIRSGGSVPPRAALAELPVLRLARTEGPPRGPALEQAKRACRASVQLGRVHRESLIFGHRWSGTLEWLCGKPAAAQRHWEQSIAVAKELCADYELARTYLEVGRRRMDAALVRRAAELLERIGSVAELREARELLETRPKGERQ